MKTTIPLVIATVAVGLTSYISIDEKIQRVNPINYKVAGLNEEAAEFAKRYVTAVQSTHTKIQDEKFLESSFCVAQSVNREQSALHRKALKDYAVLSIENSRSANHTTKRKISDLIAQYGLPDDAKNDLSKKLAMTVENCATHQWHSPVTLNVDAGSSISDLTEDLS